MIIPVDDHPRLKFHLDKYDWKIPNIPDQKFRDYLHDALELTENSIMK